ncbi:MAG: hypothetical protein HRT61_05370 [Ekhidna sp.]|nr:hypothetical protein [Ekhidna sp.]
MQSTLSSFERSVLKAVMIIGLLRAVLELSLDNSPHISYGDLFLDLAALVVFGSGFMMVLYHARDIWIRWLFFVPLTILVCIGLYQYGGLTGSNELTIYAVLIIINLTMRNRSLVVFNLFLIGGVGLSLFLVKEMGSRSIENTDESPTTFYFISLAVILLINISKNFYDKRRLQLKETTHSLETKVNALEKGNQELKVQNVSLESLRDELEEKVLERTKALQEQNEAIEEYMNLVLVELVKPYEQTIRQIKDLSSYDDQITEMLISSGNRLQEEVEKLTKRLKDGSYD